MAESNNHLPIQLLLSEQGGKRSMPTVSGEDKGYRFYFVNLVSFLGCHLYFILSRTILDVDVRGGSQVESVQDQISKETNAPHPHYST